MVRHPVVIGTVHDMVPLAYNYPACLEVNVRRKRSSDFPLYK
jgi:hypothetical protein